MIVLYIFLVFVGVFVFLPIAAYLVMKFGTAGWLKAKERAGSFFKKRDLN